MLSDAVQALTFHKPLISLYLKIIDCLRIGKNLCTHYILDGCKISNLKTFCKEITEHQYKSTSQRENGTPF